MKEAIISDISIEWDDEKNRTNIKKHGISFQTAAYVFSDNGRVELYDEAHSIDEDRYAAIGRVGKLLFVVYTERADTIRLISARIATKEEGDLYNEYNKGAY